VTESLEEESIEILKVLEQGYITSSADIGKLNIVDLHRCNGIWANNSVLAMQAISGLMVGRTFYSIFQCDLRQFPKRADFPVWHHAGNHLSLARLYWNAFHELFQGQLQFHDSPDFSGTFFDEESSEVVRFQGDIGQIAASTFCLDVLPHMKKGDLWISVVSAQRHIVIEFLDDIGKKLAASVATRFGL
jgi:hypothetical protein